MNRYTMLSVIAVGLIIGWISTTGYKSQSVRLVDVFLLGPLMIYIAWNHNEKINALYLYLLLFFGATTISYNARNYCIQS